MPHRTFEEAASGAPEPATIGLMGFGLGAVALFASRHARSAVSGALCFLTTSVNKGSLLSRLVGKSACFGREIP